MKVLGVIPARLKSTRLEKKLLQDLGGTPIILWVYYRALASKLDEVVVATDSEEIYKVVNSVGGNALMTSSDHPNGTSRIAEILDDYINYDIVINIQGDEPLIDPQMINILIDTFKDEATLEMATLKHLMHSEKEIDNPNNVKVITCKNDYALYFSRSRIPFNRLKAGTKYYKHIGIYGYKKDFIKKYLNLPQGILEETESLEQLRVLEYGYKIKVLEVGKPVIGVDTKEDLDEVRTLVDKEKIKAKLEA